MTAGAIRSRAAIALVAAWLAWSFDIYDAVIFNFIAPNCIPALLHLPLGSPAAKSATAEWTGNLTAVLLVGWAIGGTVFGQVADRIGRGRALMLTVSIYALGTAACALAPSLPVLIACRFVAALGIGGEWAASATLIAETVPERFRMIGGALLQTASPAGIFMASGVTWLVLARLMPEAPLVSWRYVFATGLAPVAIVLIARLIADAPPAKRHAPAGLLRSLTALFSPALRPATLSGFSMAFLGLIAWWSCNAFLPTIGAGLGAREAAAQGLAGTAAIAMAESWKAAVATWFNVGGVVGALLTVPVANRVGRRGLFAIYYAAGAAALLVAFGPAWPPLITIRLTFLIGFSLYGIFGAFTYYLPELFPPAHRGLGAGFTFNIGRLGAAAGPFLVGAYSARQADPLAGALHALSWCAVLPMLAVLVTPFIVETRRVAVAAPAP